MGGGSGAGRSKARVAGFGKPSPDPVAGRRRSLRQQLGARAARFEG
jgi:hypothetical protein